MVYLPPTQLHRNVKSIGVCWIEAVANILSRHRTVSQPAVQVDMGQMLQLWVDTPVGTNTMLENRRQIITANQQTQHRSSKRPDKSALELLPAFDVVILYNPVGGCACV